MKYTNFNGMQNLIPVLTVFRLISENVIGVFLIFIRSLT